MAIKTKIDNKTLAAIINKASAAAEKREAEIQELTNKCAAAKAVAEEADHAKESAEDEEAFLNAKKRADDARELEGFYNRRLAKTNQTPSISEGEYNKAVAICESVMQKTRAQHAEKIRAAMQTVIDELSAYENAAGEVNSTLEKLDSVSGILQLRYRDEGFRGWEAHALRYDGISEVANFSGGTYLVYGVQQHTFGPKDPDPDLLLWEACAAVGNIERKRKQQQMK